MGRIAALLLCALCWTSAPPAAAALFGDSFEEAMRLRIERLREGAQLRVEGAPIAAGALIAEFYERRDFRRAWGDKARRQALLALVEDSYSHGLDPADYHAAALKQSLARRSWGSAAAADQELLLTDTLVRLVYTLRFGKANPRELYAGWDFKRSLDRVDPVAAVEALVSSDDLARAVSAYGPQLPAYRNLRQALARYRALEARGGWPALPPGPTLKPGARGARVVALRQRLAASGDLASAPASDPALFDEGLAAAVQLFQARHGLEADGAVGRRTLAALNVGVAERIAQIQVNLERIRWVAQDLTGDFLLVDIAGFSASLQLDGRVAWASRVVVGRPYRRTPVFRATLRYIELNPRWVVPPTILREDVLPKVIRDPGFLEKNDMTVVDNEGRSIDPATIDWSRYRSGGFPYLLVRAPGADNPLGQLKFVFPNPYTVYLHDTPAKELFRRPERAFSSGCIRVEEPRQLALLLLDPEQWNEEALDQAIATGATRVLRVKRPVPVLVLYFTAEAGEDGVARFHPDLYQRDPPVLAALNKPLRLSAVDGVGRRLY